MAISERDVKRLWGLAAGQCGYPECRDPDCLPFLNQVDPTVLGEMAHVIPQSPSGPRGTGVAGEDTYENLILLCPTHHTMVDKEPSLFPEHTLRKWKADLERRVKDSLTSPSFNQRGELVRYIADLLSENKTCWKTYGPESAIAKANPVTDLDRIWNLRKLSVMVPNNSRIVSAIKKHRTMFDQVEYRIATAFIEHAGGFEGNCTTRTDGVPKFPKKFEKLIYG